MNFLSKYLQILLLNNDCVIVPGLGGFIAHNMPARWVEEEALFLPPYRTIGFNANLNTEDILLAQLYAEVYEVALPEAQKILDKDIESLKSELLTHTAVLLEGIGELRQDVHNVYHFTPIESGLLTPSIYGLNSLSIKPLPFENYSRNERKSINFKNKIVEIVRYAVVAVVATICFFAISPSVDNSLSDKQATFMENIFGSRPIVNKKVLATDSFVKKEKEQIIDIKNLETQELEEAAIEKKEFAIVLASAVPLVNAQQYVEKLQQKGIETAEVYKHKTMTRVFYKRYTTEEEARKDLSVVQSLGFEDAWIFHLS